jgi:hypothetical protein
MHTKSVAKRREPGQNRYIRGVVRLSCHKAKRALPLDEGAQVVREKKPVQYLQALAVSLVAVTIIPDSLSYSQNSGYGCYVDERPDHDARVRESGRVRRRGYDFESLQTARELAPSV